MRNKASIDAKQRALELISRPEYQRYLEQALDAGTLAPELQKMLHYYAWGKPPQALNLRTEFDPAAYLAGLDRTHGEEEPRNRGEN